MRNYSILLANNSIFWIGISFISPVTIMPLFVSHLTGSNLLVGAVPAIVQLSWAVPQLLGPAYFEGRRFKRQSVAYVNITGRILFMGYGAIVVLFTTGHPDLVLALFFVFVFIFRGTSGFTSTGWVDILGKVVHPRERGRFLGLSQAAGGILGALGVWLAARIIGENAFPAGFGASMILAGAILAFTPALLLFVDEPPSPAVRGRRPRAWRAIAELPQVFRIYPQFFKYVVGRITLGWGMMAFSFFAVYSARMLGASDGTVVMYTAVMLVAQTISNIVWGIVNDRAGSRYIPIFGGAAALLATALAAAATGPVAMYGAFIMVGAALGAFTVSDLSVILDMAPDDRRPTFMAAHNLATAPLVLPAPLMAGLLADLAGFRPMFAAAAALTALGVVMIWRMARSVPEGAPAAQPAP